MSLNPQAPQKAEGLAISLLSLPFVALGVAGSQIAAALKKKPPSAPQAARETPVEQPLPDITANQRYLIADRVFSTEVGGRKVSFYQYFSAKVIRITCRQLRHLKPVDFTPAMAESASLVFDIDGAIQWVRKHGLEPVAPKSATQKPRDHSGKRVDDAVKPHADKGEPNSDALAAQPAPLNIVPETGSKGAPFTGYVVSFGPTKRSGGEGKQPYVTYSMKIASESGAYEKEFIGEHLSDLVTELGLKPKQLVRIQLLGKHHFEVEVAGKMQARSRNHYSITIL